MKYAQLKTRLFEEIGCLEKLYPDHLDVMEELAESVKNETNYVDLIELSKGIFSFDDAVSNLSNETKLIASTFYNNDVDNIVESIIFIMPAIYYIFHFDKSIIRNHIILSIMQNTHSNSMSDKNKFTIDFGNGFNLSL